MTTKTKPLVCTHYAYQSKRTKRWWSGDLAKVADAEAGDYGNTFADSPKTPTRLDVGPSVEVVPCRVRALSPRAKASRTRTR